jgi:hypothetical protein
MTNEQGNVAPDVGEWDEENERRLDMMSGTIDISAELAATQTAEKRMMNSATVNGNGQEDVVKHSEEDTIDGDVLPVAVDDNSLPIINNGDALTTTYTCTPAVKLWYARDKLRSQQKPRNVIPRFNGIHPTRGNALCP